MKNLIYIFITLFLFSCTTTSLTNKTKNLELGMSKKKVISTMGKDYKLVSVSKTKDGDLEIISYGSVSQNSYYQIYLLDGKLIKWQEERARMNRHTSSLRRHNK